MELVPTPEWGAGTGVLVTGLGLGDLLSPRLGRAEILARCALDERGDRLFDDTEADALSAKDALVLDRLLGVIRRISRRRPEDGAAAVAAMRDNPERRFAFRLALALGMTVAELSRRMTSAEFVEWQAFATIEPFGGPREDIRAGQIASAVANVNRDPKARTEPFGPADFFPELEPAAVDIRAKVRAVFAGFPRKLVD